MDMPALIDVLMRERAHQLTKVLHVGHIPDHLAFIDSSALGWAHSTQQESTAFPNTLFI